MKIGLGIGVILFVLVLAALFFLRENKISEETHIEKLSSEFISCLPDKLTESQVDEVSGILERFYERSSAGKVEISDQIQVKVELVAYIQQGEISMKDLNKLMAKVSFLTFKSDPNYNLPEGSVDHPLLVPEDE
jgi:hypothetical protein